MIKALIVEDQLNIASHLHELITSNFSDISIVGICDTVSASLAAINLHQPDLVFMDVELTHPETGFDILRKLSSVHFKVIFTTAYNQYAIQAIKFSALDFLLKPIDEEELRAAVHRFITSQQGMSSAQHQSLLTYHPGDQNSRMGFPDLQGTQFVPVRDIVFCEGESSQASIHLASGKKLVVSRTLKECEENLLPFEFCRIHKSYLINLHHLEKYHKGEGGYVVMSNGMHLDVSKTYKENLSGLFKKL